VRRQTGVKEGQRLATPGITAHPMGADSMGFAVTNFTRRHKPPRGRGSGVPLHTTS